MDHAYMSQNKTKKVAWFVSHCDTTGGSAREKYVAHLQKYIQVSSKLSVNSTGRSCKITSWVPVSVF